MIVDFDIMLQNIRLILMRVPKYWYIATMCWAWKMYLKERENTMSDKWRRFKVSARLLVAIFNLTTQQTKPFRRPFKTLPLYVECHKKRFSELQCFCACVDAQTKVFYLSIPLNYWEVYVIPFSHATVRSSVLEIGLDIHSRS